MMISPTASKRLPFSFAAFVALALSFFISVPVYAQVAGATLTGTVIDASGAVIPNAKVFIKNTATGITREVATNTAGLYLAPNLLPGNYEVTTSATGFSTQLRTGIELTVGASQVLDISLQVGQVTDKVEVTGAAPEVQLETSTVSAEASGATIRELPLNGRDWTAIAELQPGVSSSRTQAATSSPGPRGNRGYGNQLATFGHAPTQNNYRVNGISVSDYSNGSPGNLLGAQLGVDAIAEFSVLTANYSAEYGRASGSVINAITKSGSNQLHGSAFWFLRDKNLDARNFFDTTLPPFHRNQFGASGGAPIRKDKTFIFAAYEGIRQDLSASFHNTVPTAAVRSGKLCSVPTTGTCMPTTITVDQNVQPYLPLWPLPNGGLVPGANGDVGIFNTSGLTRVTDNYETVRVDHKISDRDSLSGSYFYDGSSLTEPDSLLIGITQGYSQRQMVSAEWTHIFSPTIANTARLGFSRTTALVSYPVSAINPLGNDKSLGPLPDTNAPILTVPGLTMMQGALGDNPIVRRYLNSYQAYDDAVVTKGAQSIKFGFAVEHLRDNSQIIVAENGDYTFPSLQGFLQNKPTSFFISDKQHLRTIGTRQTVFGAYVQDDWRVRRNLTLNLGFRYEPTTLPIEVHNGFQAVRQLYGGLVAPVKHPWENATLKNFQPRVGFAWDPFHSGKTSVRGAFGIYDFLPLPWIYSIDASGVYPFTILSAATNLPPGSFPTGAPALAPFDVSSQAVQYFEPNPHRAYIMNWNFTIQREVTPSLTATVGYVGSHGVHMPLYQDDSSQVLPKLTSAGYLWPFPVGSGTRLNTHYGAVATIFMDNADHFSGLQAQLLKRLGHGLQAQASYTYGKCIDTGAPAATGNFFQNSVADIPFFNSSMRRGLCDYDLRHVFVGNFIWQLPTSKVEGAVAKYILGGWQAGAIISASTGSPFSVTIAGDPLGQNSSAPIAFPSRLPGPGCADPVNPGNPNNYIKVNCFIPPVAPASFAAECQPAAASVAAVIPNTCMNLAGNSGRNSLTGPGLFVVDFSLFKNNYIPKISESFNIQFRAEFFNIFNRANFQGPLDFLTVLNQDGTPAAAAGTIDATTTTSRQIQFGLKIIW
jgi:hypothetical protein